MKWIVEHGALGGLARRFRRTRVRGANFLRELGVPLRPPAYVVYDPDYATLSPTNPARHAIDTRRADRIVRQLEEARLLAPSGILAPEPASRADLLLVHPAGFLDEITRPEALARLLFVPADRVLGAGDQLRPFLLQTGGTILAVERALAEHVPVFNLGGGFHHAQRDRADGFCPVNDIAVGIERARQRGLVRRVLVVDLDFHHGNGTALIFSDDEEVFTFSVHAQSWTRIEGKTHNLDIELPPGTADGRYLAVVRHALEEVLATFEAELAIYVAGADPHREDEFGDFALSDDGMLERDLLVLRMLREADVPAAVVLGGGYGPLSWTLHYNFVHSVLAGDPISPRERPGNIEAAYRRVKSRLTVAELKAGASDLDDQALDDLLQRRSGGGLFMEYYTRKGLEIALERYGFLGLIRERGFHNLLLSISTADPERQILRIHFDREDADHLLVELVVRFRTLVTPALAVAEGMAETYRVVSIEWLLMQNPLATFSLDRQRLPGQQHPGLGLGRWMVELLRMMAERLDCTGLMNVPEHYHNAYLYSKQMLCFDPADQGYLEALMRDLGEHSLVEASAAVDAGRLRDARSGAALRWEGRPQVMPVKPELNRYFTRPSYIRAVAAARERQRFVLAPG